MVDEKSAPQLGSFLKIKRLQEFKVEQLENFLV